MQAYLPDGVCPVERWSIAVLLGSSLHVACRQLHRNLQNHERLKAKTSNLSHTVLPVMSSISYG